MIYENQRSLHPGHFSFTLHLQESAAVGMMYQKPLAFYNDGKQKQKKLIMKL